MQNRQPHQSADTDFQHDQTVTPLNILYVVPAPRIRISGVSDTSGPARHVNGFVDALRRAGLNVSVWLSSDQWYARSASNRTEQQLRGSRPRLIVQDFARIVVWFLNFMSIALKPAPDVVYERLASMQIVGLAQQLRGAQWILESNGLFFREASVERKSLGLVSIARQMERFCYRRADLVVAVSDALKIDICKFADISPEKVIVVRNAIDSGSFPTGFAPTTELRKYGIIGFVGTLVEWQGVDRVLHAVALMNHQGTQATVHVIGDGPAESDLKSLARKLEVPAVFHGRIAPEAVSSHVCKFDVAYSGHVMQGTVNYHSPLKLYEYAACGVPIVTTFSEDAEILSKIYPVIILPVDTTDQDLNIALTEALAHGRQEPLIVTYDSRIKLMLKLLRSRHAR